MLSFGKNKKQKNKPEASSPQITDFSSKEKEENYPASC